MLCNLSKNKPCMKLKLEMSFICFVEGGEQEESELKSSEITNTIYFLASE